LLVSKRPLSRKLLLICLYKKHDVNACSTLLSHAYSIHLIADCSDTTPNNIHSSKETANKVFFQGTPSVVDAVEVWAPLRIPLIPILTLSLVVSLMLGDLLLFAAG
jgi:hypothetical protein